MGGGAPETDPMAIASLVTGILSIVCCWFPCISMILPVAAVGTGVFSIMRQNKEPQRFGGKPLAIAGIVMGGLFLVFNALMFFLYGLGEIQRQL